MASNGRTDPKSGMLGFDEATGRKIEAVYLTSEAAARRQALRGALRLQSGEYGPPRPPARVMKPEIERPSSVLGLIIGRRDKIRCRA
jgi:hypothetical protein